MFTQIPHYLKGTRSMYSGIILDDGIAESVPLTSGEQVVLRDAADLEVIADSCMARGFSLLEDCIRSIAYDLRKGVAHV